MIESMEKIVDLAREAFHKLHPADSTPGVEAEEIEFEERTGHWLVTFGYWERDSKPSSANPLDVKVQLGVPKNQSMSDFLHPWRRKYKQVKVDAKDGKVVSIKIYGHPMGV